MWIPFLFVLLQCWRPTDLRALCMLGKKSRVVPSILSTHWPSRLHANYCWAKQNNNPPLPKYNKPCGYFTNLWPLGSYYWVYLQLPSLMRHSKPECLWGFCQHLCLPITHTPGTWGGQEEGVRCPGTRVTDSKICHKGASIKPGSSGGTADAVTAKPSLQPHFTVNSKASFCWMFSYSIYIYTAPNVHVRQALGLALGSGQEQRVDRLGDWGQVDMWGPCRRFGTTRVRYKWLQEELGQAREGLRR